MQYPSVTLTKSPSHNFPQRPVLLVSSNTNSTVRVNTRRWVLNRALSMEKDCPPSFSCSSDGHDPTRRSKHMEECVPHKSHHHLLHGGPHRAPEEAAKLDAKLDAHANGTESGVASRWRELAGCNDWEGLLEPSLDPDLRNEILRYGDFCQVTEDAFPYIANTAHPTGCAYPKRDILAKVGRPKTGYSVERYLYCYVKGSKVGPQDPVMETNWSGFVAVCTDEAEIKRLGRRDIVVAWRGTKTTFEWLQDSVLRQEPLVGRDGLPGHEAARVTAGFWHFFADYPETNQMFRKHSAGKQAVDEVARLLEVYRGEELSITCTGHSLGGALATYCAYQLVEAGTNKIAGATVPVTAITFASPRAGDVVFRRRFEELGAKCLRVKVDQDLVPCTPPGDDAQTVAPVEVVRRLAVQNWGLVQAGADTADHWFEVNRMNLTDHSPYVGYTSVGTTLRLDFSKSPYLRQPSTKLNSTWSNSAAYIEGMIGNYHNLQAYLHLVAGDDHDGKWTLRVDRDLAQINKSADVLAAEYAKTIPGKWWKLENNGMVQNEDGSWVSPVRYDPQSNSDDYD
ncbi:hypothetical protein MPTK1_8g12940 [Marchantia polymorpha subsp. ruderalis]|nr:hypothetical protein MARPO_0083s0027 [Marchantia polymorpha]BBN19708.1 hypothetical protein Mp_8g12940 [Marchantia polymorpha subsp. ruderalis]|eukprot:PTQ34059.1 hypothetical protein MARPO_0083s0027 [Marchantia polymorpha]